MEKDYNETKEIVLNVITEYTFIGVQVDHYTASNYYPFANVCATFVDKDFQFQYVSIGTMGYDKDHTAIQIYDSMEGPDGVIATAKLSNTIRVYTTDNCASMESAFSKKQSNDCFGCYTHILHLVVKKGLQTISSLVNKLHALTAYIHKSSSAMLLLKDRQRYLDLPDLNVLSDCPTRWGSFLKNGRRLIEIKQPLSLTLNKEERDELDLTFKEWLILEDLVKVVAPFDAATTLCSGKFSSKL